MLLLRYSLFLKKKKKSQYVVQTLVLCYKTKIAPTWKNIYILLTFKTSLSFFLYFFFNISFIFFYICPCECTHICLCIFIKMMPKGIQRYIWFQHSMEWRVKTSLFLCLSLSAWPEYTDLALVLIFCLFICFAWSPVFACHLFYL